MQVRQKQANFWYVLYAADYRSATVLRAGFEDVTVALGGGSGS